MAPIDPEDADTSLEDCARHLDQFVSVANYFHVKGDDKYIRSVECIIFMSTNGRIPTIDEMTTDEFGLRSMSDIEIVDLRMSSRQWELQGLVPSGKALDHASMYGTDVAPTLKAGCLVAACSRARHDADESDQLGRVGLIGTSA
jgi:hypothetical protein